MTQTVIHEVVTKERQTEAGWSEWVRERKQVVLHQQKGKKGHKFHLVHKVHVRGDKNMYVKY